MTPHRDHGRGTLKLEIEMRELGTTRRQRRISVASGTTDERLLVRLRDMLRDLREMGRLDLLRGIRDKRLKPLQVWAAFKRHQLHTLPTEEEMRPLAPELEAFRLGHDCSASYRRDMQSSFKALLALGREPSVADLPTLLSRYRDQCRGSRHRMFNAARSHVQSFLRHATRTDGKKLIGRTHNLYLMISEIEVLPYKRGKGHPQLPGKAREIARLLGEPWGANWWSMCLTGMGPDEYWGDWNVTRDRVAIRGTKRDARERIVPVIGPISTPRLTAEGMRSAFQRMREREGKQVALYDARRSFELWMIEAGVPRIRRKIYLGHAIGASDIHELYEEHEVKEFLGDDAAKLQAFLGETGTQLQAV